MTLNELSKEIHGQAVANGFWDDTDRRFPERLTLAHSELSEAFEAWRDNPHVPIGFNDASKPEGWATELVDCIIVCLDILSERNIDIEKLMEKKLLYNTQRPYRHGRSI